MGTIINGKELTTVSVEQIRALADKIHEAKANAVGSMKEAFLLKHEQGLLLVQAELELGDAFDAFVEQLSNEGVDPDQARDNYRLAKKHKDKASLLSQPGVIKQLVLRNFAPDAPKVETEKPATVAPYTISVRFNVDPLDPSFPKAKWLADPLVKSVIQTTQELEQ